MTDASAPTEWKLQEVLTSAWTDSRVVVDGEPLFLAAWEVMDDWKINDPKVHWTRPSIDFLFLDVECRLVVAELKRAVRTPRECWSALCQVTHRAHVLTATLQTARLQEVYAACMSGRYGRVPEASYPDLIEAHRDFFGLKSPLLQVARPVRRVVLALEFGAHWAPILQRFDHDPAMDLASELSEKYLLRSKSNLEIRRFVELALDGQLARMAPGVAGLTVDPSGRVRSA